MTAPRRRRVLGAVLVFLGLPVLLVLVEAASFHLRNRNNGTIVSSGEKREYLLHVPPGYRRGRRMPLVVSLHGASGWPAQQMRVSGWNRLSDRDGFLVVYPSAVEDAGPRVWRVNRGDGLAKDVRFLADLIDRLEADYGVDPARVYANGLSNGGGMSFVLSCALSDRIAAVGLVAAAHTLPWSWCTETRPVPMIAFHGTADPIVPYTGGGSPIAPESFPNIPRFTSSWAVRNGCAATPLPTRVAADVTRLAYPGCAGGADVVLYEVWGGGHSWPGGAPLPEWFVGTTSRSIDATREMWNFFREHPLRRPAPMP